MAPPPVPRSEIGLLAQAAVRDPSCAQQLDTISWRFRCKCGTVSKVKGSDVAAKAKASEAKALKRTLSFGRRSRSRPFDLKIQCYNCGQRHILMVPPLDAEPAPSAPPAPSSSISGSLAPLSTPGFDDDGKEWWLPAERKTKSPRKSPRGSPRTSPEEEELELALALSLSESLQASQQAAVGATEPELAAGIAASLVESGRSDAACAPETPLDPRRQQHAWLWGAMDVADLADTSDAAESERDAAVELSPPAAGATDRAPADEGPRSRVLVEVELHKAAASTMLGLTLLPVPGGAVGVVVGAVADGSIAAESGSLCAGDVIREINGEDVTSPDQAATRLRQAAQGVVRIAVSREGAKPDGGRATRRLAGLRAKPATAGGGGPVTFIITINETVTFQGAVGRRWMAKPIQVCLVPAIVAGYNKHCRHAAPASRLSASDIDKVEVAGREYPLSTPAAALPTERACSTLPGLPSVVRVGIRTLGHPLGARRVEQGEESAYLTPATPVP